MTGPLIAPAQEPSLTGLVVRGLAGRIGGPFDLDVAAGRCTVIAGPSGIGKSLLLRMIADLDPSRGSVTLADRSREVMRATEWRRKVTYVAAESGWWTDLVAAHLDVAAAQPLLRPLGLRPDILEAAVAEVSTGERQRLALIRAVIQRPAMLLLDEPTSALDHETTGLVEALLARLKADGLGLLVVSHDAAQAARIADTRLEMSASGLRLLTP